MFILHTKKKNKHYKRNHRFSIFLVSDLENRYKIWTMTSQPHIYIKYNYEQ